VCGAEGLMTVNDSIHWSWSDISPVTGEQWQLGGEWKPATCVARYHMAVIIPFRDRDAHLIALLRHLIPLLQRQMIHFRIFVVEQVMLIGPIPWGRSGPICHALSLLSSSTSMRRPRATVAACNSSDTWWMARSGELALHFSNASYIITFVFCSQSIIIVVS